MKKIFMLLSCLLAFNLQASESLTLAWEDLIPESEKQILDRWEMQAQAAQHDQLPAMPENIGKARVDLNGKQVKIPGFVIPLEGDETTITEMLLVPYFGACYHVPPPPANQIIHVKFKNGIEVKDLWDVVYVIGELRAQASSHDLAEVGYSLQGVRMEDYEDDY
jgi:hypothetical protein